MDAISFLNNFIFTFYRVILIWRIVYTNITIDCADDILPSSTWIYVVIVKDGCIYFFKLLFSKLDN